MDGEINAKKLVKPSQDKRVTRMMKTLKALHSRIDDMDIETRRKAQDMLGRLFAPILGFSFEEFTLRGIPSAWIRSDRCHNHRRCILYCHGGGYNTGNLSYARILGTKLSAATGRDVLAFEYRLAPEFAYPSQLDDAERVWNYLMYLGYGAENVVVAGESAGGNLALALSLRLKKQGRRQPKALVLMSPWTDLTASGPTYRDNADIDPMLTNDFIAEATELFTRGHERGDPFISPAFADLTGLAPVLLQVGGNEILLSDSMLLKEKLEKDGVLCRFQLWRDMWHVFQMFPLKEANQAMEAVGEFILEL